MANACPIKLSKGDELLVAGVRYRVLGQPVDSNGTEFNLEHLETGRCKYMTSAQILELYWKRELTIARRPRVKLSKRRLELLEQSFDSRPEKLKEEARRRYRYVRKFYEVPRRRRSKKVLDPFIAEVAQEIDDRSPPSARTLCRWLRFWEDSGRTGIAVLVPAEEARGDRVSKRLHPQASAIVDEVLEEFSDRAEPVTVPEMHALVRHRIKEINFLRDKSDHLAVPSVRCLYRRLQKYSGYTRLVWREGERAADLAYRPVGRGPEPTMPLEEVEIDHHRLDLIVLDEEHEIPIGRPWLTLAIDRATRQIIGFALSFAEPSYRSVMQCLHNAIAPKNYLADMYPSVRSEWPACGLPSTVVVDNAREFHGRSLDDACATLNINFLYTPVRSPWFKGKVERVFGRLAEMMRGISGTTLSSIQRRKDYDSKGRAAITLSELNEFIHKWVADIYNEEYHRGIKDTPNRRWRAGVAKYPVTLPDNLDDLDVFLAQVEYRKLSRNGIELFGLHYNSPLVAAIRMRPGCENHLAKVKVDPADIGTVRVEDPATKRYIDVPCVDRDANGHPYAEGLSLFQHEAIAAYVRARVKGAINIDHLARAKVEIRTKLDAIASKRGKTTKRAHRFLVGEYRTPVGTLPRQQDSVAASSLPISRVLVQAPPQSVPLVISESDGDDAVIDVGMPEAAEVPRMRTTRKRAKVPSHSASRQRSRQTAEEMPRRGTRTPKGRAGPSRSSTQQPTPESWSSAELEDDLEECERSMNIRVVTP